MKNSRVVLATMLALSGCPEKQHDFNNDGHPDSVESNPSSGIMIRWGTSQGYSSPQPVRVLTTWGFPQMYDSAQALLSGSGYSIRDIADVNGDGQVDLVYCRHPSNVKVPFCIEGILLNNGEGTFRFQK